MTAIAPTRLFINGIEAHGIEGAPIRIPIPRGFDWTRGVFKVTLGRERPEDKALLREFSEVTLTLQCADPAKLGSPQKLKLKKFWVISRRVVEDGFVVYEIANNFWRQRHKKLTASYNILSYGGFYRLDSVPGAVGSWYAYEAAEDALQRCGYTVEANPKLDPAVRQIRLPDNLSNAEGGGWAAAEQELWGPSMFESMACDPVQMPSGNVMIVDRVTKVHDQALFSPEYMKFSGEVNQAHVLWQEPAEVVFSLQKRIERQAHYRESGGTTASNNWDPPVENVIPNYVQGAGTAVTEHTEITNYVKTWFVAIPQILKTFLRKLMFDIHGNFTAAQLRRFEIIQGLVRQCFRRRYRFKPQQAARDDIRSHYACVELGRLQSDGTNKPGGVYMDHTRDLRYGKTKNADDNPLTAKFSENVPYDLEGPAPYTASWLPGAQDDLIFTVDPDAPAKDEMIGYIPGLLTKAKGYGDSIHEALQGKVPLQLDDGVELDTDFNLYVYWHGLWVYTGDANQPRLHEVKRQLFPGGKAPTLYYPLITDMTANYGWESNGAFPGRLLNAGPIDVRCRQLEHEVRQALQQERAGVAYHAGLDIIKRGNLWVSGDVHELEFEVHGRAVGSLETHVTVLPGKRPQATPVLTGRRARGELPARFL